MSDDTNSAHDLIHIRVMNDYCGGLPLWPDHPDDDVEELDLSEGLRADLMAFADRWDAAIDPEVTDDRWDGVPVMQRLVDVKHSLGRLLHPARERAAEAEREDIRRTGEALAVRVQDELGPAYRVRYVH
jgi:hypothetical protein